MSVKFKRRNAFNYIHLERTTESIDKIVDSYHKACPSTLPVKVGTALSILSRLLPQFKDEGLTQDRMWVIETSDDDNSRFMTAVIQNRNHNSMEPIFSHSRITGIEDELNKHVDCSTILRHSFVIDDYYDLEKVLKLVYEQFQTAPLEESVCRTVPVLITDNAGTIPDTFPYYQLSISNSIKVEDFGPLQKAMGKLNYCIIKYAEQNPDAINADLKKAIKNAEQLVSELPYKAQSNSAIMFLATGLVLYYKKIFSKNDVLELRNYLKSEAVNRTSLGNVVSKAVGKSLSTAICSGTLGVGNESSPPFWKPNMAFAGSDGSINVTRQLFVEKILQQLELPVGHNKIFQALKENDLCFANPGEDLKTRTVIGADGVKNKQRFVSLSRRLLSEEANRKVDVAVASDMFHKLDKPINNFFPFMQHQHLNMVAGQIIND